MTHSETDGRDPQAERLLAAIERIAAALERIADTRDPPITAQDDSGGTGNGPPPK